MILKYKLVLVWNIGLYFLVGIWNSVLYFIVGVCPFFDTVGQRLQMGDVSCLSINQNESCSARYISTTVYKCKPSIWNIKFHHYDNNKKNLAKREQTRFLLKYFNIYETCSLGMMIKSNGKG